MSCLRLLVAAAITAATFIVSAQNLKQYMPKINGTVRAKYEFQPQQGNGRFEVRNARLSVSGKILPIISYKAEIDLSDEGKIKMLDAYGRFSFKHPSIEATIGQMRVPFSIDAHRSPHQQYFANRSFIAKQVGNVRDVGLSVSYKYHGEIPFSIESGIFNGSGLTNQKDYWTKSYNFSAKATSIFLHDYTLQLSCQKARQGDTGVFMWDVGAYFDNSLWHVEGEFLRKTYNNNAFKPVNAIDSFILRRFPMKGVLSCISGLVRYDYMSDHSNGVKNNDGLLQNDDPERHRLTGGITFTFGKTPRWAELRLNYEKYFYNADAIPGASGHDKIVAELMVRF